MSFLNLKEFKEELSQAVNELVEEENTSAKKTEKTADVNTSGIEAADVVIPELENISDDEMINTLDIESLALEEAAAKEEISADIDMEVLNSLMNDKEFEKAAKKEPKRRKKEEKKEDIMMDRLDEEIKNIETVKNGKKSSKEEVSIPSDEVAEITKGMRIEGNVISDGSINVSGKVKGDVTCRGKLVINGTVVGVSSASEVYTNNARICGDVISEGSIKVGNSSVIIGNVVATSAVVGGAIKGDLDVRGPVVVDGTAVIQGNIKSRSVQINNGAVIEGIISQCYADVDYDALFDKTFTE